ncbi:MAG TPA: pilin [Gammaproteobacteria bacterium]
MNVNPVSIGRWCSAAIIPGLLAVAAGCSDSNGNAGNDQPDYRTQAEMSQLVASLDVIRVRAESYQGANGHFPESLADMGMDPATASTGTIESVRVNHGQIVATARNFEGWVSLTPVPATNGARTEWKCATNVRGMVTPALKCEYSGTVPEHP